MPIFASASVLFGPNPGISADFDTFDAFNRLHSLWNGANARAQRSADNAARAQTTALTRSAAARG